LAQHRLLCFGHAKRFATEETILTAFGRSVGDVPLRHIRPAMISQFLDRNGTNEATVRKKHRVLAGFFRFAVTRRRLRASPMPSCERKRGAASYTPYIYSEAELKRLLAAVPAATGSRSDIDSDTLRTLLLLLYGAGLRRGEARRLKVEDVDVPQSLIHIRGTKFFKTRIGHVYGANEAVTREQALRLYTSAASHYMFEENKKGTLEVGKFADLTALSADLMAVPEEQIKDIKADLTIVGDKIVFQR
jgi:integrase